MASKAAKSNKASASRQCQAKFQATPTAGPAIVPPDAAWPPSADYVPSQTLQVRSLFDDPKSDVMEARDFLTSAEAEAWVSYGEARGFELAQHPQTSSVAHRDCGRLELDDPQVAGAIFQRLKTLVPPTLTSGGSQWTAEGCAPNVRLYRYGRGQRFGKHYDQSNDLSSHHRTFYTVLIYLNGEDSAKSDASAHGGENGKRSAADSKDSKLSGGETQFYHKLKDTVPVCAMVPLKGACLIHAHGERCLLHEGAEVTSGVKVMMSTYSTFIFFLYSLS